MSNIVISDVLAGRPQLMRHVRNNGRAQFEAQSWIALLWKRVAALLLPPPNGEAAAGLPKEWRF